MGGFVTTLRKTMVFSGSRIHQPVEAAVFLLRTVTQTILARDMTSELRKGLISLGYVNMNWQ